MSELDKCVHADENSFESKEGEQRRLSSNNVSNCSPSLGVKANNIENSDASYNPILTPETIEIFGAFALTLKKIHIRLTMEGYVINDGKIFKPCVVKNHEKNNPNNSTN